MAKAKAAGDSKSKVIRRLFEANKELLKVQGVTEVLKLFEAKVGRAANDADRGLAANMKSKLRKESGLRRRRRKGKASATGTPATPVQRATASMLALEDSIDDCIYFARKMESEHLTDVVRLLRKARNSLILLTGSK